MILPSSFIGTMDKYIIFAEDDVYYSKIAETHFLKAGYEITIAVNGKEAIHIAKKKLPDLFLIDLIMPVIDGFETIRLIKSDEKLKGIKVVAISNLGQPEDIQRAINLGATDYIVKQSSTFEEIVEKVNQLLLV